LKQSHHIRFASVKVGKSFCLSALSLSKNKTRIMDKTPRVLLTEEAKTLIDRLRAEHGALMFHQSGGCCDGSAPMCFPVGEFKTGINDVLVGTIHDCEFFMSAFQFEYWQYTQLTLDVVAGRGASFSLEIPLGLRFMIRSNVYSAAQLLNLAPVFTGEEKQ
jgi:uncharacterized protein (DUF779 family)